MSFWLVIALTLAVQESLATIAVLVHAQQLHYSPWSITLIWGAAASIEITIAYSIGKWVRKTFADSKIEKWTKDTSKKLELTIGKYGETFAIFLVALTISPLLAAFLASWLDISFGNIFILSFLGDLCWYLYVWTAALGAEALWVRAKEIAIIIFILIIVAILAYRFIKPKKVH